MRRILLSLALVLFTAGGALLPADEALAGAKLQIDDEASIDLGFRAQYLLLHTQKDLDGNGSFESVQDMKVRRARLRVKGVVNPKMTAFLQTELGDYSGAGQDMRLIDAWICYKEDAWAQVFMGLNMVPASRQNLTSSGALMAVDRPGLAYKSLNWGSRTLSTFSNSTYGAGDSGLRTDGRVRDIGMTLFGSGMVGEGVHMKYYMGIYDGEQPATSDREQIAGRIQFNFGDAEPGYFNSSTYLGKKSTLGIGASFASQKGVGADDVGGDVDYGYVSFDGFLERELGAGALTLEGGYAMLDLDEAWLNTGTDDAGSPVLLDLRPVQGSGYYVQCGYLMGGMWQPWAEYEAWTSDADDDLGGYTSMRFGLTYFVSGHHANLKAGVEVFKPEVEFSSEEDTRTSAVFGAYITY